MTSPTPERPCRPCLRAWETALLILGTGALTLLLVAGSRSLFATIELAMGLPTYFLALRSLSRREDATAERLRLALNALTMLWFYGATSRISLALAATPRDHPLLAIDEFLFERTPAVALETWVRPWLTDTLSVCYLSHHAYLLTVVIWGFRQSPASIQRLSAALFAGFVVGFFGYLFVPALGPRFAFPGLFSHDLGGGMLAYFNNSIVAMGSASYGNFPSLHVLATALLLDHDWRACRQRFWIMLVPATGMLIATIYLRYHYAADLLASVILFPLIRAACVSGFSRRKA